MYSKKMFLTLMSVLMLVALVTPTFAWVYHDNLTEDGKYEDFGPRADRLLIKLYASDDAEFDALEAHDIDITDWPVPKTRYEKWTDPEQPYKDYIRIANYGPEFGLFILDMNSNPNEYLGNPPNASYPNPVYPNPMSVPGLRRAIAHLVNRAEYLADPSIGAGFGYPMYTTMPPAMEKYVLDVTQYPEMPWAYEYSREAANALLDASGFADRDAEGYRIWNETGETVVLIFYIRSDHPGRNMIGTKLLTELDAVGLKVDARFGDSSFCVGPVMVEKNFHLYTGGWSLGVDPDHLILWSWNWYWHPGFCYNYGGHNDPEFNEAADGIMYANTQEEAVAYALQAQYRQAYMVLGVPLYCAAGNKAWHKTYVGNEPGEGDYYGKNWVGLKNILGYGIDNGVTFANMHPEGIMTGTGDMTIRWGFKSSEIKMLNPIYAQWLWDWNVMGLIYPSLLSRNPNDLGTFDPVVVKQWWVSTYTHEDYGECTKIRFQLRDDVCWSDGEKLTVDDIFFTFVELKQILEGRGLPNPWWYSNVQDILSFSIIDPCTFEVLLSVKSYWALGWIGGNIILPEHIWRPIAETGDPEAAQPDPALIGATPWLFDSYTGVGGTVLLLKNPNYWLLTPIDINILAQGNIISPQKIKPCTPPQEAWFEITLKNLKEVEPGWTGADIIVNKNIYFINYSDASETLVKSVSGITIPSLGTDVEDVTLDEIATALGTTLESWPVCHYGIKVEVIITGPAEFATDVPNPWVGETKTVTFEWWGTLREDLNNDCTVDIFDIVILGLAFGARPGDPHWDPRADVVEDALIDIFDIVKLALVFGFPQ